MGSFVRMTGTGVSWVQPRHVIREGAADGFKKSVKPQKRENDLFEFEGEPEYHGFRTFPLNLSLLVPVSIFGCDRHTCGWSWLAPPIARLTAKL